MLSRRALHRTATWRFAQPCRQAVALDTHPAPYPATCRHAKQSLARRKELESQLATLASGLGTVQQLLQRQGLRTGGGSRPASRTGGGSTPRSPGRRSKPGAPEGAMAVLSALLRGLQSEQGAAGSAVVSPQASEGPGLGPAGDGGLAGSAQTFALPPASAAAEQHSDPLEQADELGPGRQQQQQQHPDEDDELLDITELLPEDGQAAATWQGSAAATPQPAGAAGAAKGTPAAEGGGEGLIGAAWQPRSGSATSRRSVSRIPGPPPAAKLTRSPRMGSPGRGASCGLKALLPCGQPSPQATLSSGLEASAPSIGGKAALGSGRRAASPALAP